MRFCPDLKCVHYSKATKYSRACYYEPQCWKGYLDAILFTIGVRFRREHPDSMVREEKVTLYGNAEMSTRESPTDRGKE